MAVEELLNGFAGWIDQKLEEPLIKESLSFSLSIEPIVMCPVIENIPSEFINGAFGIHPFYNYFLMMARDMILTNVNNGLGVLRPLDDIERQIMSWIREEAEYTNDFPDELKILYPDIDSLFLSPPEIIVNNKAKIKKLLNVLGKDCVITEYNEVKYLIVTKK